MLAAGPLAQGGRTVSVTDEGAYAMPISRPSAAPPQTGDAESSAWLQRLRADAPERDQALGELRELLLKAARFEVHRRTSALPHLRGGDGEDLAQQSANDALLAVLGKLDDFRGESRFTTWAYKFALLEAAVKIRRRAWQGREVPLEAEHWGVIADGARRPTRTPRRVSSWVPCRPPSNPSSLLTSARSSWPAPSTASRSTCLPSA